MKRTKRLIALVLCVALMLAIQAPLGGAEPEDALGELTQGVALPESYTLDAEPLPADDVGAVLKDLTVQYRSAEGESAQIELKLSFTGFNDFEAGWTERASVYTDAVIELCQRQAQLSSERLARDVLSTVRAINDQQAVQPDAAGTALAHTVIVTVNYYETLQRGSRSDAVVRLQQRLIELGFLDGDADGQFGPATAAGVSALQEHVRLLEQEIIDAMPTPEPTVPAPAAATDPEQQGEELPEPTPEPLPTPQTELNGIADARLQAYLFSDKFSIASPSLDVGDKGSAVTRLQNRLIQLGCMAGKADGDYGETTRRSVRIFQYYNGLEQTGVADRDTQQALYSSDAKRPPYPMLSEGSKGDDVRALQQRLKLLGFMVGSVDGSYGAATVSGVKNLQQYMRMLEEQQLAARTSVQTGASATQNDEDANWLGGAGVVADTPEPTPIPVDASEIATVVDGVADPLLMEQFFADSFPAMPEMMKPGSKGLDVERLQRRLTDLEYLFYSVDGDYGEGTTNAVKEFQERNKLSVDGSAGADTLNKLFSASAKIALKPYVLKISIDKQRVYAYAPDENEEYTRLVRTMKCSTGLAATPTPKGTFQAGTGPGARWHYFKKFTCWAQYAYYIQGDIMFHSVLYGSKGGRVTSSSVYNLGRRASHGCVRLSVEDAKWIWNNCPRRTKVIVY